MIFHDSEKLRKNFRNDSKSQQAYAEAIFGEALTKLESFLVNRCGIHPDESLSMAAEFLGAAILDDEITEKSDCNRLTGEQRLAADIVIRESTIRCDPRYLKAAARKNLGPTVDEITDMVTEKVCEKLADRARLAEEEETRRKRTINNLRRVRQSKNVRG